jgi:hypothetical protein
MLYYISFTALVLGLLLRFIYAYDKLRYPPGNKKIKLTSGFAMMTFYIVAGIAIVDELVKKHPNRLF